MDWDKKTDEQYNTYMTVMAGGDNENEAHLTEEEWVMVTGEDALSGVWQPEEKIKPVSDHKWASLAPKSELLFGQTNSNHFLSE